MKVKNHIPEEVIKTIQDTQWTFSPEKDDDRYQWVIFRNQGNILAVLAMRKKWTTGGITFDLTLIKEMTSVKIKFSQSSINQFKSGKGLFENAIDYAATIADAHYSAIK